MSSPEIPDKKHSIRVGIPWWLAFVTVLSVWGIGSWVVSLLTPRYGWTAGYPGPLNLFGLIPIMIGTIGLIWTMQFHSAQEPKGLDIELAQSYLLRRGPYAFSRNPTYLFELAILSGWVILYGSFAVLTAFIVAFLVFNFINVPLEKRALKARFGETYLEYKNNVPRWVGTTRHRM